MSNYKYSLAIITLSDKAFANERIDESGPLVKQMMEDSGNFLCTHMEILPDDLELLKLKLISLCDIEKINIILTTGGTGFSPRDNTPEATLAIGEKNVPGIAEAMRMNSLKITNRAMLSRGVAVIRKSTLIINLPGSTKAVRENLEFILDSLNHGLDILLSKDKECGNQNAR
ncbi:MogA/MoaB family molybdenum cofactor biosynthesis protein [Fusobacterium sp. PH5-44]|uniref:MogA/MoaB family molybdenum cofactor biosynthesis protein n=1 Tax=unclassified Fusobacterium TaxID=2648384 RepID=UPI003D242DE9